MESRPPCPSLANDLRNLADLLGLKTIPELSDSRRLRLALVQTWLIAERITRGIYDPDRRVPQGPSRN